MLIKASFFTFLWNQIFYLICNYFVSHIPCLWLRMNVLRLMGGGNFFKNYYRYALACNGGEEVEYWKTLSYKPELYA